MTDACRLLQGAYPESYPQFWVAGSRAISTKEVAWLLATVIRISWKLKNTKNFLKSLAAGLCGYSLYDFIARVQMVVH